VNHNDTSVVIQSALSKSTSESEDDAEEVLFEFTDPRNKPLLKFIVSDEFDKGFRFQGKVLSGDMAENHVVYCDMRPHHYRKGKWYRHDVSENRYKPVTKEEDDELRNSFDVSAALSADVDFCLKVGDYI